MTLCCCCCCCCRCLGAVLAAALAAAVAVAVASVRCLDRLGALCCLAAVLVAPAAALPRCCPGRCRGGCCRCCCRLDACKLFASVLLARCAGAWPLPGAAAAASVAAWVLCAGVRGCWAWGRAIGRGRCARASPGVPGPVLLCHVPSLPCPGRWRGRFPRCCWNTAGAGALCAAVRRWAAKWGTGALGAFEAVIGPSSHFRAIAKKVIYRGRASASQEPSQRAELPPLAVNAWPRSGHTHRATLERNAASATGPHAATPAPNGVRPKPTRTRNQQARGAR